MIINVRTSSCEVYDTRILVGFLMKLDIFSTDFIKNIEISNFTKIRPVGAELFHVDRRAGRHDDTNSRC